MPERTTLLAALQDFADAVRSKMSRLAVGEPEDQLRGPFENFLTAAAHVLQRKVVCTGETKLPGRLGKPDYAVHLNDLLAGYAELKAPGVGANPSRFRDHNRDQWKRFRSIPNLLYCDGNEWGLYRSGELTGEIVHLSGDITTKGKKAVSARDAHAVERLLSKYFSWQPVIPTDRKGKIDLGSFAEMLAPLCRMLRDDVTDALEDPNSPLVRFAENWRQLLFPDASNAQFADAYAQTVTFALLLGRSEGADPLTLESATTALAAQHSLLSGALQVLTDPGARAEIAASLDLLLRVIAAVPLATLTGPEDPWLYFYEDFLAAYDPELRKKVGAYYTPVEVVRAQVRLIDDLLVSRLGKPVGFADSDVITLDPAAGTGTFLLGVIEHALSRVEAEEGAGAVPGHATALAANLHGFELMVGPYAVAELRVSRALRDRGASLPRDGTRIYLTDTLESPYAQPPPLPLFLRPIVEQHAKALHVKSKVPVIVCLGNPPYGRHDAVVPEAEEHLSRWGGWVRFGDSLPDEYAPKSKSSKARRQKPIMLSPKKKIQVREKRSTLYQDFTKPALDAGHGVYVKNLYNLYVYFWRWALWKVFEHETSRCPGIVSFISASSYLDGDAFCGMREHMRRLCEEIWILDLGGEGRGARKSDNVFAIQTPVAIAIAVRSRKATTDKPAKVHYARIEGTRDAKLAELDAIRDFTSVKWQDCPSDWQAPFRPPGEGSYFDLPLLADLMPWTGRGIQFSRTWPVSADTDILVERWKRLLSVCGEEQKRLLKETRDVRADRPYLSFMNDARLPRLDSLGKKDKPETIEKVLFRSFDEQWCIADRRLIDMPRPALWRSRSPMQVFTVTLGGQQLAGGPVIVASPHVPDINAFNNRGGVAHPLYRAAGAREPNILPGLLDLLTSTYCRRKKVTPEDFLAYVHGALAHPAFSARYAKELETRELRVPITKDATLFNKLRDAGARLLWLHTYGERFVPEGKRRRQVPRGKAKCVKAVPGHPNDYPESVVYNETTGTLHVGDGEFRPVAPEVYEFEVSGLKVVQSWLKYRMKKGANRKSSPLDDIRPEHWTSQFTTQLLELLWVLEATLEKYGEQAELLSRVVEGPCFRGDELPSVPDWARKAPAPPCDADMVDQMEQEDPRGNARMGSWRGT